MAELETQIRDDLKTSMKAKDTVRTGTLRMALAAIQTAQAAGDAAKRLSDADVVKVLAKESKKRLESAQVYADAGRTELADKERVEERILAEYLPAQLDDAELAELVDAAIEQVRADTGEEPGMRQMGKVMQVATARADGRADGKRLSSAVKSRLA